jgi:hypothetical protein
MAWAWKRRRRRSWWRWSSKRRQRMARPAAVRCVGGGGARRAFPRCSFAAYPFPPSRASCAPPTHVLFPQAPRTGTPLSTVAIQSGRRAVRGAFSAASTRAPRSFESAFSSTPLALHLTKTPFYASPRPFMQGAQRRRRAATRSI